MFPIVINIDPVLAELGPLAVRWYGLMYVVGILAGLYVALPFAARRGLTEDQVWDVFWPCALAGFIGARLYFVIQQPLEPYLAEPWRVMATWEGGMAFYGAIFAVVPVLYLYTRWRGIPLWPLLDAAAVFGAVGQAFGRLGNLINGDIVGYATNLPWGVIYAHPRSFVADHQVAYQPAAAYEVVFNVVLIALLWQLSARLRRPGLLFASYLMAYSAGQFLLFFVRANEVVALGLKQAQLTAIVVLVLGAALAWVLSRSRPVANEPQREPAESRQ